MKKMIAVVAAGLIYVIGFEQGGNFAQKRMVSRMTEKIDHVAKRFASTIEVSIKENLTEEQISKRLNGDMKELMSEK